jgi:hypothetical protein
VQRRRSSNRGRSTPHTACSENDGCLLHSTPQLGSRHGSPGGWHASTQSSRCARPPEPPTPAGKAGRPERGELAPLARARLCRRLAHGEREPSARRHPGPGRIEHADAEAELPDGLGDAFDDARSAVQAQPVAVPLIVAIGATFPLAVDAYSLIVLLPPLDT